MLCGSLFSFRKFDGGTEKKRRRLRWLLTKERVVLISVSINGSGSRARRARTTQPKSNFSTAAQQSSACVVVVYRVGARGDDERGAIGVGHVGRARFGWQAVGRGARSTAPPPPPPPRPVRPCGRTDELCARNGRTDGRLMTGDGNGRR